MVKINYPDKYIGTEIETIILDLVTKLNSKEVPSGIVLPYGCDMQMFGIEENK